MKLIESETGKYIIRTNHAGVFFAGIQEFDETTRIARLTDCRRLWYWDGAASLSQLAAEGTKAPSQCKFTVTVPMMDVMEVIEIIPVSAAAVASIDSVAVWKR